MAAGDTATEGDEAVAVTAVAVTAVAEATETGTVCRRSQERRTDRPPHTFAGMVPGLSVVHFMFHLDELRAVVIPLFFGFFQLESEL